MKTVSIKSMMLSLIGLSACTGGVDPSDMVPSGSSGEGSTGPSLADGTSVTSEASAGSETGASDSSAGSTSGGSSDESGGEPSVAPGCKHFVPGHYVRQVDSVSRGIDGLANIGYDLGPGGPDLTDFVGIVVQIDWAMIEPELGLYDFSRTDALLELIGSAGKHMRLKIMERTFWDGCSPPIPFVPDYVSLEPSVFGDSTCYGDVWNQETMDGYIAMHIALAERYDDEPAFVGFNTEETAIAPAAGNAASLMLYDQRVRLVQELLAAVPGTLIISEFNWPVDGDPTYFTSMLDESLVAGTNGALNGMGISWPDSWLDTSHYSPEQLASFGDHLHCTQSVAADGKVPCSWYDLGRSYNHTTIVAPNIEGGVLVGDLEEAEALYQMLDTDIGAHMITWDSWTGPNPDYLRTVAIPTIRNHDGVLQSSACPFVGD